MNNNKHKKEQGNKIPASVTTEMALPRMSKSARIAELNLDTARISEQPKTVMPGTVNKLIPSPRPSQPEKAQISIEGEQGYRDLRIDNSLTDEHGDDVKLKKGAHVEITVATESSSSGAPVKSANQK
jgi:hypothetical protein